MTWWRKWWRQEWFASIEKVQFYWLMLQQTHFKCIIFCFILFCLLISLILSYRLLGFVSSLWIMLLIPNYSVKGIHKATFICIYTSTHTWIEKSIDQKVQWRKHLLDKATVIPYQMGNWKVYIDNTRG